MKKKLYFLVLFVTFLFTFTVIIALINNREVFAASSAKKKDKNKAVTSIGLLASKEKAKPAKIYNISMFTGGKTKLSVYIKRANKWKSNKKSIASVSADGTLIARKKGIAVITAFKGKTKYTFNIKVKNYPTINAVPANLSMIRRNGKKQIYTGLDELDYLSEVIIHQAGIKASMSDEQIVKKLFTYMSKNFVYRNDAKLRKEGYPYPRYFEGETLANQILSFNVSKEKAYQEGWITYSNKYVIGVPLMDYFFDLTTEDLEYKMGVCDNHAAILAILCNHLGIKAGTVSGTIYGTGHKWNWIIINGKKYYFDIGTSIHKYTKNWKVDYSYFKISKKKMVSMKMKKSVER